MRSNDQTVKLSASLFPTPKDAIDAYQQTGGQLTLFPTFGNDPLNGHSHLQDAQQQGFNAKFSNFERIFSAVVNGNEHHFRSGLKYFISLTTDFHFQSS